MMIREAAAQARGLTRSMLTIAGNGPSETQIVNLVDLTSDCLNMIRQTVPRSIETELNSDSDKEILVDVDAEQIKQVLVNLFLNARDAMPGGGRLSVSVQSEVKDGEAWGWVEVCDTGVGIPTDQLDRIFEPFYTTKAREEGTGLGLAMVHGIVNGHKGSISVDSTANVGTCFKLRLPCVTNSISHTRPPLPEPTKLVSDEQIAQSPKGRVSTKTVLVAEDREPIMALMVRILEKADFRVLTADNGARALEIACKSKPDVLILDVDMPILDGITVLKRIRSSGYATPAVIVSGALVDATPPPNTSVLLKPFTAVQLQDAINQQLSSAQPSRE